MSVPDALKLLVPEVKVPCVIVNETSHFGPDKGIDSLFGPASFIRDANQRMKVVIQLVQQVHAKEIPVSSELPD